MTQAAQGQEMPTDRVTDAPRLTAQTTTDSASDNETSEKAAREKFKKTSLASLTKRAGEPSIPSIPPTNPARISQSADHVTSPSHNSNRLEDFRGRPAGKRALEDSESPARENPVAHERQPDPSNGHNRKRSRDFSSGEHVNGEVRSQNPADALSEGAVGSEKSHVRSAGSTNVVGLNADKHETVGTLIQSALEKNPTLSGHVVKLATEIMTAQDTKTSDLAGMQKASDHEMKDGAYSPRKKRSRDQMDTETDREQKIAATDEARAHRRSDELDRSEFHSQSSLTHKESTSVTKSQVPPKATFGTTNIIRPPTEATRSMSPAKERKELDDGHKDSQTKSAPSAFAVSGFAALANLSTSAFGNLSGPSSADGLSPSTTTKDSTAEISGARGPALTTNGGFSSFAKAASSGFGRSQLPSFSPIGSNPTGTFGGSAFGGGFGGGFGTGNKLTSFAAPTGDAKLGSSNGAIKPIGSPYHDEDDDNDRSESEGEGEVADDGAREVENVFQHQDVETGEDGEESIFSSRAILFSYKDNAWREGGKGMFKLNVFIASDKSTEEQRSGRFIMRAHQTYRVLLNQTIFPQMKVGDRSGNEPSGKAFAFAALEDGKPIPHMVKLADLNESKTLYHEVRKIQQGLA